MPRTQTTANARAAEYWSQVAPSWLEFEHELETISERPGQLAMNRLDLEPGHTVVDLGCGSGLTTVQLAERVGEAGSALGVDISAELLTEARRRADKHGAATSSSSPPIFKPITSARRASIAPTPDSA